MSRRSPAKQTELFLKLVDLVDEGEEVIPPAGLVYSQHPRRCLAEDGQVYFTKGPLLNVVVPEVIAHLLGQKIGLRVPEFALARRLPHEGLLFASREVRANFRAVDRWLASDRISNPELLGLLAVFDVLIANKDRNIGNIIGEDASGTPAPNLELVAIDFEKAEAFRGRYPLTTVPLTEPAKLRPSGILGSIFRRVGCTEADFKAVEAIGEADVFDAFGKLEAALGHPIEWGEGSAKLIEKRARGIRKIYAEVWA